MEWSVWIGPSGLVCVDMDRYRVRIRFRKEGDLRLTSHRDLVRAFERMFRRAELQLRMSEGFHPKARMSFPSALSLGIAGLDESMDVELIEATDLEDLHRRLESQAPPGLAIVELRSLGAGEAKAQVSRFRYAIELPEAELETTRQQVAVFLAKEEYLAERSGRSEPIDVRAGVEELEVSDGELQMTLTASRQASVRPRDVLNALGLKDIEATGAYLRRTAVEFAT